jgi:hypothetical protein
MAGGWDRMEQFIPKWAEKALEKSQKFTLEEINAARDPLQMNVQVIVKRETITLKGKKHGKR